MSKNSYKKDAKRLKNGVYSFKKGLHKNSQNDIIYNGNRANSKNI